MSERESNHNLELLFFQLRNFSERSFIGQHEGVILDALASQENDLRVITYPTLQQLMRDYSRDYVNHILGNVNSAVENWGLPLRVQKHMSHYSHGLGIVLLGVDDFAQSTLTARLEKQLKREVTDALSTQPYMAIWNRLGTHSIAFPDMATGKYPKPSIAAIRPHKHVPEQSKILVLSPSQLSMLELFSSNGYIDPTMWTLATNRNLNSYQRVMANLRNALDEEGIPTLIESVKHNRFAYGGFEFLRQRYINRWIRDTFLWEMGDWQGEGVEINIIEIEGSPELEIIGLSHEALKDISPQPVPFDASQEKYTPCLLVFEHTVLEISSGEFELFRLFRNSLNLPLSGETIPIQPRTARRRFKRMVERFSEANIALRSDTGIIDDDGDLVFPVPLYHFD